MSFEVAYHFPLCSTGDRHLIVGNAALSQHKFPSNAFASPCDGPVSGTSKLCLSLLDGT